MIPINIEIVLVAVAFAWHYALFCGFISDDHATVEGRTDIIPDTEKVDRGEGFWTKRFNDGLVMFYLDRIFFRLGLRKFPFFWHLFSLCLHVLNTYLLYLFLGTVVGHDIALYACAFWAVNPMLNQNVVWVSGRPYLIAVTLTLLAFICYENPVAFIAFYFLAVVTNIAPILSPIMLWLIHPNEWQSNLYVGSMFFMALPFLVWKFNKRFTKGLVIDRENFNFRPRKIFTFFRMVLYYTWTLFCPVRMGWYHQQGFRYNEKWEKFNYLNYIGLLLFYFYVVIAQVPGWWFILGLLPVSNIYATNSFLQDRYLYWASIGVALIVAPWLAEYPALFYIAMTFYITRTIMYSRHLKDDEKLYRENWRNHPFSDYAINNLSYFLIQKHRYDEARVVIEQGLNINRQNKMLWYNLGITHASQGHFSSDEGKFRFIKALECWKTCLQIEPRWGKPAEQMKLMVKLLVDNKVLTLDKGQAVDQGKHQVVLPNLDGLSDIGHGKA